MYGIMLSANSNSFTSSLPVSFSCPIAVARTSNTLSSLALFLMVFFFFFSSEKFSPVISLIIILVQFICFPSE